MKHILLVSVIALSLTSCSKPKEELSQEQQERSQPLKENQFIENEKGGLNFFVLSDKAQISVRVLDGSTPVQVFEAKKYHEYEILAEVLRDNTDYTVELQFHSVDTTGVFDFVVEGFTSIRQNKEFRIRDIPVSPGDVGKTRRFLKMSRGIVLYTFTRY